MPAADVKPWLETRAAIAETAESTAAPDSLAA
jgi:hypothetical protein